MQKSKKILCICHKNDRKLEEDVMVDRRVPIQCQKNCKWRWQRQSQEHKSFHPWYFTTSNRSIFRSFHLDRYSKQSQQV